MTEKYSRPDLTVKRKLIVGEGPSDLKFFQAFCAANKIKGYAVAFTGMWSPKDEPSGFQNFKEYLIALEKLAGFLNLTDLIITFDSAEDGEKQFKALLGHISDVNRQLRREVYTAPIARNLVSREGMPRLHALSIPHNKNGGLESICFDVARDNLDQKGANGTQIEEWVNKFAGDACQGWTIEKRAKLRLQAFLSVAWKKFPEGHFSQIFDLTKDKYVPLTGAAFDFVRSFLESVAAL